MLKFSALVILALVSCSGVLAQQKSDPTQKLYIVTYVDVFGDFADNAAKTLQQFANDSRKDAGCVRFEVLRDVARANHFSIVELWQNRAAYETHLRAEHSKHFREVLQQWLGSP